jgi:predicted dehydrogenase
MDRLPDPRTPDPTQSPTLRWGIVGPGWIAQRFVNALNAHTTQEVAAVASRSAQRAHEFAGHHSIPHVHHGLESLLADDDIDIVYISTPHIEHRSCALAALRAGKHVLVEKPMGINAAEAADVLAAAREHGLFAGEAMWTKFLPKFDVIRQILDNGMLGDVRTVVVDNGEYFSDDHRIYNPALLGGPMLDMGIYPISFMQWVLGDVETICAAGQPANADINGQISAVFTHTGGNQSVMNTTIMADTPRDAMIAGTDGYLSIPGPYYQPGPFSVVLRSGEPLTYKGLRDGHENGLHYSAVEAARIIAAGGAASAIHPRADIIATLTVMDRIRSQIGIRYPGETNSQGGCA